MKKKIAIGAAAGSLLLLVAVRVVAAVGSHQRAAEGQAPPPLVPAVRVARGEIAERVLLTGSIRPRNAVEVHPELAGRIAEVHAKVGDRVRAGQLLATIGHEEIAWQARGARAAVEVARANLAGASVEHGRM